jgi:hypothetical protein
MKSALIFRAERAPVTTIKSTRTQKSIMVWMHWLQVATGVLAIVMTPWEGRWWHYQARDGMRVPLSGEVAWLTAKGRRPYWRGTITSLRYEYAE